MKLTALAAAIVVGGVLGLMAPTTAEAMPRAVAPVDVTESTTVHKAHGRHCRIRRGHRSRCRRFRRHSHRHCHRRYCHRHRHRVGRHHGSRHYGRPRVRGGIYLRLF